MLELQNIKITQGGFCLTADMTIAPDRTTAIIGPSGGGKSTLLLALAGFVGHRGKLCWQGRDITALPPARRPVSMLFQEHNLFDHLSIAKNVGLGLRPDLKLSAKDNAAVAAALARVGLAGKGSALPRALSGGQRQRAALARTLLRKKPLLLLDEPFAALGPALRCEMLLLVEAIRAEQHATLLLVTHSPEDARKIAADCIFVDENKAMRPVDTTTFFRDPPPAFRAYLGE